MKEQVSAMMDGELADHECSSCVKRIKDDPRFREETWDLYHLIGDALRGHLAPSVIDGVREKLAVEPLILAPGSIPRLPRRAGWYALSAAASIAAIALVAWMALALLDTQQGPSGGTKMAEAAAPAPVPLAQGVNDYLLAHQRFSPSSTIGGIAPYVRTVAEDNGGR
jgi:sigma-E factor negative regulatory protein RseA